MSARKTQTLEQELQDILAAAMRNEKGEILADPFDMTYEEVVNNDQDIVAIVNAARPYAEVGAVAEVEKESAAREVAKQLLLLVSKFDYEGKAASATSPAIPAGTDWLRKNRKTRDAVDSFYGEIIPLVPVTKWMVATGNPASEFPFRKSVEYHFGNLRRQVLPTDVLKAYGLASDSPNQRVQANLADLNVALTRIVKMLDGVKIFPKEFDRAKTASVQIDSAIQKLQSLQKAMNESFRTAA